MYDWANSGYATVVIAGFFPIFFKSYWSDGAAVGVTTFRLGLAHSLSSLVIVLIAPVLGAIADQGGTRKRFLLFFAAIGILMTGGLYWLDQGQWPLAVLLFVLASIGFMGANVFYDALLVSVAPPEQFDRVSALGFAMGYLGGGLLFALCVLMTLEPGWFGLTDAAEAVRVSFVLTALWWAIFAVPLFLYVDEHRPARPVRARGAVVAGFRQLVGTFNHIRRLRMVALFLAAYWLYIDGVDTIIRMAVDYGLSLGFDQSQLILALLITQFVGFPAAVGFGLLGERIGTRNGLFIGIGIYVLITAWAATMEHTWEFYGLAVAVGLVQGGVQALSRSFYARLIPPEKSAEFFGFYNILGKFAAIFGPLMVGWISVATGNPRLSILSILVLFVLGALLLSRVDVREGRQAAREL
jgi:UMF1 family MFS transporter